MSSMPWVKLYTEMLDDAKIGRLQDAIKWRFVSLVLLAGECDQDGALMTSDKPMSIDDIAWRMRITREQCETELESLLMCGVIALDGDLYYLPKFSDRQGRPQSEKRALWRERKARQRESQENQENVTRDSRVIHAPRVDKSREEKIREEPSQTDNNELQTLVLATFNAKRFKNKTQSSLVAAWDRYPIENVKAACTWAAMKGFGLGQAIASIEKALPKWDAPKPNGNGNGSKPQAEQPRERYGVDYTMKPDGTRIPLKDGKRLDGKPL